nr:phage terminase large subunit [Lysinibacillus xylanilyticus]
MALKILLKLLQEKRAVLVVREVYDTHRDSTFSLFTE